MGNRARAHGAWFQGTDKNAAFQAMIATIAPGLPDCHNFGMAGGIGQILHDVFAFPDNLSVRRYKNRANRNSAA